MLSDKFKHRNWFKGNAMTNKDILDYVLKNSSDFIIIKKAQLKTDVLTDEPNIEYFISDRRYKLKLDYQERNYLAVHNSYFAERLPKAEKNWFLSVISSLGEPIKDGHDLIYFSR